MVVYRAAASQECYDVRLVSRMHMIKAVSGDSRSHFTRGSPCQQHLLTGQSPKRVPAGSDPLTNSIDCFQALKLLIHIEQRTKIKIAPFNVRGCEHLSVRVIRSFKTSKRIYYFSLWWRDYSHWDQDVILITLGA